jgi:ferredoxin
VPAWLAEVDVVISLPKLKTHLLTLLTCALKNVYGLIPGEAKSLYHGNYPSPRSMAAFLADVFARLPPALNIVDAVLVLEGDGPSTGTPRQVGLLLAGTDAAAIDACCAGTLGLRPSDIPLIAIAGQRGLGVTDLGRIHLCGSGLQVLEGLRLKRSRGRFLQHLPSRQFKLLTWLLTYRPEVDQETCVRCGVCSQTCSQQAIPRQEGQYRIDRARCILCMCCLESCPHHAIQVRSPALRLVRGWRRLRGLWRRGQRPKPSPGLP